MSRYSRYFFQVQRWVHRHLQRLTGKNIALLTLLYIIISALLLFAAQEHHLIDHPSTLFYYLLVTASTVGYGDLAPTTTFGQWAAVFFIIPCGIGLFAVLIGRIANVMIQAWQSPLKGAKPLTHQNHIVILGWRGQRTLNLINMLQHEERDHREIVLIVQKHIENPLPGEIGFVRVERFTSELCMNKGNLRYASCIIIDNPEDDMSLAAALFCAKISPNAHLVVHFENPDLACLVKQHCIHAECIPSISVEFLAKSAVDPGSSQLHYELLNTTQGMTQYSLVYPGGNPNVPFKKLMLFLKEEHDVILIAIENEKGLQINPKWDITITANTKLHYIADERITPTHWQHTRATK